jgi:hypothetical protein
MSSNDVDPAEDRLAIRLIRIAESQDPVLRPLGNWARAVGGFGPLQVTIMDPETIESMAALCGVKVPALIAQLRAADAIIEPRTGHEDRG